MVITTSKFLDLWEHCSYNVPMFRIERCIMAATDTDVRARVHSADKEMAAAVLEGLGLKISDLIRMAIVQTAKLKKLPFENKISAENLEVIKEIESGKAVRLSRIVDLDLPN